MGCAGDPHAAPCFPDRSVQIVGDWGGGNPRLVIEGSNDGKHYAVLNDQQGVYLEFTQGGLRTIAEPVLFLRPRVIGGDKNTKLTAILLLRRNV